MAHAAMAVNLTTPVNFAVTEGGSASISIPIQVVRGLAGMEPQLSLSYSSGAGNGLLGIGWTLTGPSAITRCPKNRVTDGVRGAVTFGPGDRYCLDGQRLEIISPANGNVDGIYGSDGTEYRTERDSFSRIKAYGNSTREPTTPDRFTVETKSGLILEFGRDANSRVTTKGRITARFPFWVETIKRWMLQRISDRQPNGGNFVEFFYCGGEVSADGVTCTSTEGTSPPAGTAPWSGSKVLHYIRYTNHDGAINGEYGVVVRYENRPDRVQGFHAGTAARQTQRIVGIDTYRNFSGPSTGQLVRSYNIAYEALVNTTGGSIRATNTSRIQSITEGAMDYAVDPAVLRTLPPVVFSLAPDSVFGSGVVKQWEAATVATPREPSECDGVNPRLRMKQECP